MSYSGGFCFEFQNNRTECIKSYRQMATHNSNYILTFNNMIYLLSFFCAVCLV